MPTATTFTWSISWTEIVGGFNSFIQMFNSPLALGVAIILVFIVTEFVFAILRKTRRDAAIEDILANESAMRLYTYEPYEGRSVWDDYTDEEKRELAEDFYYGS